MPKPFPSREPGGIGGGKVGLFYQAIRLISEMREATNGLYPVIAIWENVIGAFSSNDRLDASAPEKYYLSPTISSRISRLAEITGCPSPMPFKNGVCGGRQGSTTPPDLSGASDSQLTLFQLYLPEP